MAKRPIAPKSILATVEIFAVIGIFTLYALEFAGIETFSAILPQEAQMQFDIVGFDFAGTSIEINQGVFQVMAFVGAIVVVYFAFLRDIVTKRMRKR